MDMSTGTHRVFGAGFMLALLALGAVYVALFLEWMRNHGVAVMPNSSVKIKSSGLSACAISVGFAQNGLLSMVVLV